MKKAFTNKSSSRKVSVRDIMSFLLRPILRTATLHNDEAGVRAFTLIELLVVVLIIGILSAVALPQYQKAVLKARTTEAIVILKAITDAQEAYALANNSYTNDINDLDIDIPSDRIFTFIADNNVPVLENEPNKYRFTCWSLRTCGAFAANPSLPNIEFHMQSKFDTQTSYIDGIYGKHWCQVYHNNKNETALQICKSMGTVDPILGANYYQLN